jgi:hypothetical protein
MKIKMALELGKQIAEKITRNAQYETWREVLNNINNYMQDTDPKSRIT